MRLANLDNEVHFKHVFTDVEVFTGFVKDVLGIDINIDKVETEKVLPAPVSAIKFRMDLFAEDAEKRTVVEIQKVEYDSNYNRFCHYFHANLVEMQKNSDDYAYTKEVYVIVVATSAYRIHEVTGEAIRDDVLITDTNPRNLNGKMRKMNNHKMVFLNTRYISEDTPQEIRDWLIFIAESMKKRQDLTKINREKRAINKAANLAEIDSISAEQLFAAKEQELKRKTRIRRDAEAEEKGVKKGARNERRINIRNIIDQDILSSEDTAKAFNMTVKEMNKFLQEPEENGNDEEE